MKCTALIACVALVASTTGCSFFATHWPREPPEPPSCEPAAGPVVADMLIAPTAILTSTGFGIASALAPNRDKETQYATTAGILALTGIVALTSGIVGGVRIYRCRKATQQWQQQQWQQQQWQQQPYPHPQPYPQPHPHPQPQPYPQPQPQPYPQPQQYPQPQP